MRSIRARTAVAAVVVMAAAMLVASIVGLTLLDRSLRSEIDRSVINRAEDLAEVNEFSSILGVGFASDGLAALFELDGTPVTDSGIRDVEPADDLLAPFGGAESIELGEIRDVTVPIGLVGEVAEPARAVVLETPDLDDEEFDEEVLVYVAVSTSGVDRTVRAATIALAVIGPVLLALVGGLVWVLTGRALRGVEDLRVEVAAIPADDTERRLGAPRRADELHRLTDTFNELLDRVAGSRRAQQRFIADAAHELRSPIASLRAQVEVAQRSDDPTVLPTLGSEVIRLQTLVDDLLLLSRPDESPTALADLDEVVRAALELVVVPPTIELTHQLTPVEVRGVARQLERVVVNLVANAVRHARGRVIVATVPGRSETGGAWLLVDDDGGGVPPEERQRVFERFVRLDDGRARDVGGSGLGLAIVARVVEAHAGEVLVDDGPLGGARFGVWFPPAR